MDVLIPPPDPGGSREPGPRDGRGHTPRPPPFPTSEQQDPLILAALPRDRDGRAQSATARSGPRAPWRTVNIP
jgi:hypothetical protein